MRRNAIVILFFSLLSMATSALAGGFQMTQQTARSLGIGDGGYVSLGEPVLLHINPALLGFLPGTVLSFGTTIEMPDTRFVADGGSETKMLSQVLFPPNISLSHDFGGGIAFGVSSSIPFAMNSEWDETWAGAQQAVQSEFRVVYLSPGLSWRLGSKFSLGVALNIGFPRFQASHRFSVLPSNAASGLETFDGTGATALGASLGIILRPFNRFTLGLSYMSRMKLDMDRGGVSYSELPDSLLPLFPQTTATFSLTTPDVLRGGLSLRLASWLLLEGDAQYAFWSTLQSLSFRYPEDAIKINPELRTSIPLEWTNTWTFQAGLEIGFDDVVLRAGYIYDQSPVPNSTFLPLLPDADRRGLSFGLGYFVSQGLRLDFAYQYLRYMDRTVGAGEDANAGTMPRGKYTSTWTIVGINVSYFWN